MPNPFTWIASEGGVFRSELNNVWRNVYLRPAGQIQPVINFIVVEPKNGQVIYLVADLEDGGVWKTSNGGATWATASAGLPAAGTTELFLMPSTPQTLYLRAANRIYKSTDGAATWTLRSTLPGGVTTLSINLKDPSQMYAAANNAIYRSRDEGTNWTLTPPLSLTQASTITSVLVDPSDPNIIHAAVAGPRESRAGFYRSINAGDRFDVAVASPLDRFTPTRLIADPAGRFVFSEANDAGTIYRTTDKGVNWEIVNNPLLGQGRTVLAFDPNDPRIVLVGTSIGLAETSDGGQRWQRRIGFARPTISSPSQALNFVLPAGTPGQMQVSLSVVETNQWTLPVSVTSEGAAWLSVSGGSVNTPSTPVVAVNTAGLEPGDYSGVVRVDSPASGNGPLTLPVKLSVVPAPSVTLSYRITTMAGLGVRGNFGDNGAALRASFADLDSAAIDRDGNVYLSDPASNLVRRISVSGVITRLAGSGTRGDSGDGGAATIAQMNVPSGLGVDSSGVVYICDSGNRKVRKVAADGSISTLASNVGACRGLAVDQGGNVFIAVPQEHVVRRITPNGQITVYAGQAGLPGFRGDGGTPSGARLNTPLDVAVDPGGRILIADTANHRIRRVVNNVITTVAGSGAAGYQGEGPDALKLAFSSPAAVAGDAAGNIYVGDSDNNRIRRIAPGSAVSIIAGTGVAGFSGDNGPAVRARISGPQDVVVEAGGTLLSVEALNLRIRRLTPPEPAELPQISGPLTNWGDDSTRLAPGTIFRLRGSGLALQTESRTDAPWPVDLGGARVTLNGLALPLSQVSPAEIIGLIPVTAALGGGTLVASRDEVPSLDAAVTLEPTAPAIITPSEGRALAANSNGSANSPEQPAAPDSLLSVYFTGSGIVENPPQSGAGAGEESKLLSPVFVQFGDVTLDPELARLAVDRPGVAEVRFRIPAGLETGDYPVIVRVGNGASPARLVSVARPVE